MGGAWLQAKCLPGPTIRNLKKPKQLSKKRKRITQARRLLKEVLRQSVLTAVDEAAVLTPDPLF
jgi:hypothetical protein